MSLVLYNTLKRKKEKFVPLQKGKVGLYTCGPTVYHYVHIGNLRSFIFEDVLKRILFFNDFKVNHVMNITDVGHLTSDGDEGEDKMLKGAKREKKTVWEVAEYYTAAFKEDIGRLNIISPTTWCKATDHIPEQIEMAQSLEKNGFTYFEGGNLYFDTSKLKDYGKLVNLKFGGEQARVERDPNKKNQHDFVLWFTNSKYVDHAMSWESPWGKTGYPGWHLECSAMATKYLGSQFDIHCGGHDLAPVHHTNEIAQAESATGKKPWVKYWLHNEFLVLDKGEKMAKSGDNFLTLKSLDEKGFDPLDYRYFCLGTVYRNPLMFSITALEGARTARRKLFDIVLKLKGSSHGKDSKSKQKKYLKEFKAAINDDMNTPKALAVMWSVVNDGLLSDHDKYFLLLEFDKVFGFNLGNISEERAPQDVIDLAEKRLVARQKKQWDQSDKLRDKISKLGWSIGDTNDGYELKKK